MAGFGALFNRAINYEVTNTKTGHSETFTIIDQNPLAPQWSAGDYSGAMSLPGAWRAATLLSDLIGGLPWHALRERAGQPVERVASPMLDQPNPPDTRITSFSALAMDLIMHGNAVAVYGERDRSGYPTAMIPVDSSSVQIRRAGRGDTYPAGTVLYEIGGTIFTADEVLHVKGPSKPGALRGMGVLEQHLETLELNQELNRQAKSVSNNGVPTGMLRVTNPDATVDDLKDTKAGWMLAQRTRTVAVVNSTTEFEPLAWNPSETQLIEARRFSLHELALIFGLPLWFLGADSSSNTYSNVEQESLNLIRYTLSGHLVRFEQALTLAHPRGTEVKANLGGLLRADTLTRYQAHEIALGAGWLTVNEVRALEDRPPLPGGDDLQAAGAAEVEPSA